jgi:uncharacterized tellurite resistance protein B-like protein
MIEAIKQFLQKDRERDKSVSAIDKQQLIKMAAAVLFVEVMHADHKVDKRERRLVKQALQESFSLSSHEAEELLQLAEERVKDVTSLHEFTTILHGRLTNEEKVMLLEQTWRIVLADNEVDKYEEHLVRRIAELLYIKHSDYIRAKLNAEAEME